MSDNKKILVVSYDKEVLSQIRDERIIIKTDTILDIEEKYQNARHDKDVMAMVVNMPYAAISEVKWKEQWESIPLIVYAFNVGDYYSLLTTLPILRRLNLRIYLSNANESVFTDLKFLSSAGIDCGILMEEHHRMSDELFLDFASFFYLSKGRHASIEPFEFILRHLDDDKNCSFSSVYFEDTTLFTFGDGKEQGENSSKLNSYYTHFMDLDKCAVCPAFKICNHCMQDKLEDCQGTMGEVFDMAEIRYQLNSQENHQKTICQL